MRIAVYPGTFDPFTICHFDILKQAVPLFDEIYVAVLREGFQNTLFNMEETLEMIRSCVRTNSFSLVKVKSVEGTLMDFCREMNADYIIRGLRNVADFEHEQQSNAVYRHLDSRIRTVCFLSDPLHAFLGSDAVRELGLRGADIREYLPDSARELLHRRADGTSAADASCGEAHRRQKGIVT